MECCSSGQFHGTSAFRHSYLSTNQWVAKSSTQLVMQRKENVVDYTPLRKIALFRARDTPLRCLYRLYDAVCAMSRNELMEELQYYFEYQPKWKLRDIPNPEDPDPRRQAILASLVETLVQSFNYKIFMGLRRGVTQRKPWLIEKNPSGRKSFIWGSTGMDCSRRATARNPKHGSKISSDAVETLQ